LINEPIFGWNFSDAFFRQYLVGLGEFGMDNFSEQDKIMVWIFFFLATFVTQLLFMNVLIAIMGDTFARVQEVKERSGKKERILLIHDFIWIIDLQEEFKGSKYVLVVEQAISNSDGAANSIDNKI